MVNFSEFSPRVTRSKSKKKEKVESENVAGSATKGRRKRKKGNKRKEEVDSARASRGSVCTVSLLHVPQPLEAYPRPGGRSSPGLLQPPDDYISLRSPPIGTISVDTPERSARFHRNIFHVAESKMRILGKGSFGTVIQATYKGELVAAKLVPPHRTNSLKNELNNFLLWHPNIVKTLRIISNEENNSSGLVIMEMFSPFTLEHLTNEASHSLDVKTIVSFMTDVGNALEYCHKQKILHLDVKPHNVLVNVKTNQCKLCDFGSSCLFPGEETSEDREDFKTLSSVGYDSPEMLAGGLLTEKSDVYSFGITLWQLVHREKPFVVDNKTKLQSTIHKIVKQKKRPQKKTKPDEALEKLYTACWDHEPEKRPTMTEVLECLKGIHAT